MSHGIRPEMQENSRKTEGKIKALSITKRVCRGPSRENGKLRLPSTRALRRGADEETTEVESGGVA